MNGALEPVRLALRLDRVRLPLWVLGIAGLVYFSGSAMGTTFATQRSIDSYAASVGGSPSAIALSGPPVALDTLGGIVLNKIAFIAVVGVSLMAVFTMVRHTRGEEEEGRAELLRSTVVGRQAATAAALLVALGASAVIGLCVAVALLGAAVPASGAWLYGASTAALGWVFAAVALCLSQVFAHARAAVGASVAVFGVAYVLRALGDVRGNGLVWLSPIGWSQATHPLGDERWWPLLVSVVATGALVGLAVVLARHRDVGAGLVAARPGNAEAGRTLRGPVGLALRLQRGAIVSWAAGVFVLAAVVGSLVESVRGMAADNPQLEQYFRSVGAGSIVDSFVSTMLLILGLLAAGFAVSSALRPGAEESAGRAEMLLATGLSRTRWLLGSLAVTLAGTLVVLLASGLGFGIAYAAVVSDPGQVLRLVGLQLVYAPAVLATAALAVLLHGWLPGRAVAAWGYLALCFVLGWLGGLIHPPAWLRDLSPFTHVPAVPVEPFAGTPVLLITLAVVLLVGAGALGLRRRDIR
ncbi:MAG: ABC transporter permease [Nocardioidaceae bacterium]